MKGIDFTKTVESAIDFIMKSKKKISVTSPAIKLVAAIQNVDESSFEEMVNIVAMILSNNKQKITITKEELIEDYTTDDLISIVMCIKEFVEEIQSQKH